MRILVKRVTICNRGTLWGYPGVQAARIVASLHRELLMEVGSGTRVSGGPVQPVLIAVFRK
jgi:hypothetical protein